MGGVTSRQSGRKCSEPLREREEKGIGIKKRLKKRKGRTKKKEKPASSEQTLLGKKVCGKVVSSNRTMGSG